MEPKEKRRVKERAIGLVTSGLVFALLIAPLLDPADFQRAGLHRWLLALGLTLGVQGLLWLVLRLGWDRHLAWDPHYIFLPAMPAAVLLNGYAYLFPSLRLVLLMAWFASLALTAGLVGFLEVVALSAWMGTGYLLTVRLLIARGDPLTFQFEAMVVVIFLLINSYAGMVFERLRRERLERKALRTRLAEMAITDSLTGVFNRRYFDQALRAEVARINRYSGHCTLAMIDLDFFKHYNDTHGHVAGDGILKGVVAFMRQHLRATDVLGRYGGEEFALIMVNTPKAAGADVMERLRGLIQSYHFPGCRDQPLGSLTISAGIAGCPDDAGDCEELVRQADAALYAAKHQGRNRVRVSAMHP